tara:strand:+ start:11222 stop:14605 length:3384 start_codon:yes stop_codon:yes gene_type:complete
MAFKLGDRILETTTSTGTSAIELSNISPSGFDTFQSGVGHGVGTYYAISHQSLEQWEIGYGVVTTGDPLFPVQGDAPVLTRNISLQSSSADNQFINFAAGTKDVFAVYPAQKAVFLDPSGNLAVGPTTSGVSPDTNYYLWVEGDIRASGIHAGSGIFIDQEPSAPNTTINRLYNVNGTLYWGDNSLSSTDPNLLYLTADSGVTELPLGVGSGLYIVGGENVITSISDTALGSGVITIDVPNIEASNITLSASTRSPASLTSLTMGLSSGIFIQGGDNVTATLTDAGNGSGVVTIDAGNYVAGTGININGLTISSEAATDDTAGIAKLSHNVTSDSGVAITPYGVQQALIASGVFTSLSIGADNVDQSKDSGIGPVSLATGSGILIRGGDNTTVSLSNSDGSGIATITAASYTAGSGLRLIPDTGTGAQFNIDVDSLADLHTLASPNAGPDDGDELILYDSSADTLRKISVSGLAANSNFGVSAGSASGNAFATVSAGGDTGFTWTSHNDIVAESDASTLKFAQGTGIRIDTDATNDAMRISLSGNVAAGTGLMSRIFLGAQDGDTGSLLHQLGDGSGIFFEAGDGMQIVLSDSAAAPGSGIITISHKNTSSQASVDQSGNSFIQDITLDEFGHVTALTSATSSSAGGGGQAASGSDGQLQYNNGGFFAGASGLYYDDTNNRVGIGTTAPLTHLHISGTGLAGAPYDDSSAPALRPELPDTEATYLDPVILIEGHYEGGAAATPRGGFIAPFYGGGLTIQTLYGEDDVIHIGASGQQPFLYGVNNKIGLGTNLPKARVTLAGSMAVAVSGFAGRNGSSSVDLNDNHNVILYDGRDRGASGSGIVKLPVAGSSNFGRKYTIQLSDHSPSGVRIQTKGGKIDRYKVEEQLWIKGDSMTFICGTGVEEKYDWYTIDRNLTPHSALVQKRTSTQQIPDSTNTQINMDTAMWAIPSGMFITEYDPTAAYTLDFPSSTSEPSWAAGATEGSGIGSGIRILREGFYRAEAKISLGPNFDSSDTQQVGIYVINGHDNDPEEVAMNMAWLDEGGQAVNNNHPYSAPCVGWAYLKPGDFVYMVAYITTGHGVLTSTARNRTPSLYVQEIINPDPSGVGKHFDKVLGGGGPYDSPNTQF